MKVSNLLFELRELTEHLSELDTRIRRKDITIAEIAYVLDQYRVEIEEIILAIDEDGVSE